VANSSQYILSDQVVDPAWANWLGVGSVAMSITVNALVTGLIIFKLFNVYREVKSTSNDHTLGATGGSRIRTVIFMLIKSGMMLFSIQLALFVVTIALTDITDKVFDIIVAIYQMLNVITISVIATSFFN
jgi:NADH:ubiquinone oxidoreductase subunit K